MRGKRTMSAGVTIFGSETLSDFCQTGLFAFDPLEIGEPLSVLVAKRRAGRHQAFDAIEPETAEVISQFTPGRQQPDLAEKVEGERAHGAGGASAVQRLIFDDQHAPTLRGALQLEQIDLGRMTLHPSGCAECILVDPRLPRCG